MKTKTTHTRTRPRSKESGVLVRSAMSRNDLRSWIDADRKKTPGPVGHDVGLMLLSSVQRCESQERLRLRHNVGLGAGKSARRGFTLFEVLLALALFLGTLAVLSQLWYGGVRASVQSQLRTQAILRCESKLNEVVAGVLPLQPVSDTQFEDDASWTWSLQVLPGPHSDVWLVIVNVVHPGQGGLSASGHQLSRLIRDPQVWIDAQTTTTTEAMP